MLNKLIISIKVDQITIVSQKNDDL